VKNAVFWDVTPCDSCKNGCFDGTYRLHHQGDKNRRAKNNDSINYKLKIAANVVLSSSILVTLNMEAIRSSETAVLTRTVLHHISEDGIL
jgi:hypothetical protein